MALAEVISSFSVFASNGKLFCLFNSTEAVLVH